MKDPIERQDAIEVVKRQRKMAWENYHETRPSAERIIEDLKELPSAQPAPYIDSIVSEIEKTISETRERGKHHDINVRANGEMICFGLQLALEIIEEKRNGRSDLQTGGD